MGWLKLIIFSSFASGLIGIYPFHGMCVTVLEIEHFYIYLLLFEFFIGQNLVIKLIVDLGYNFTQYHFIGGEF